MVHTFIVILKIDTNGEKYDRARVRVLACAVMTMEVVLTDVGKRWLQNHYLQGIVWEYNVDKPFKLHAWAAEFIELTCLGIPYRIPPEVDGKPTIRKHSLARYNNW